MPADLKRLVLILPGPIAVWSDIKKDSNVECNGACAGDKHSTRIMPALLHSDGQLPHAAPTKAKGDMLTVTSGNSQRSCLIDS